MSAEAAASPDSLRIFDSAAALILDAYANPETPLEARMQIAAALGNLALIPEPVAAPEPRTKERAAGKKPIPREQLAAYIADVIEPDCDSPLEALEATDDDDSDKQDEDDSQEEDIFDEAKNNPPPTISSKQWLVNQTRPYKPLPQAKVTEHCKAIEAGVLAREKLDSMPKKVLDEADEQLRRDLAELERLGKQSYDLIAYCNTALVMKVASKWIRSKVPFEDLVQYGMLGNNTKGRASGGLLLAMMQYDYRLGYKFSTYAFKAIETSIRMAIDNNEGLVRLPEGVRLKLNQRKNEFGRLRGELGREPTEQELFEASGLTREQFEESQKVWRGYGKPHMSLDQPFGGMEEITLLDILDRDVAPDSTIEQPAIDPDSKFDNPLLLRVREILTPEEWKLYVAISECPSASITELANRSGLPRDTLYRRQRAAKRKLAQEFPDAFSA